MQEIKKKKLSRPTVRPHRPSVRSRTVTPENFDILSFYVFLYYLFNSNNFNCNSLKYEEKRVVPKLKMFGEPQGYYGHFDDHYDIYVENKGGEQRKEV